MKSFYKNYTLRLAAAVLTAGILLSGCSKETKESRFPNGDKGTLRVSVIGVSEGDGISASSLKMSTEKGAINSAQEEAPSEIQSFDAFDALVSMERGLEDAKRVSIGSSSKGQAGSGLMAEALEAGVKYRLLLYKADGSFESSTLLTSGVVEEIPVAVGEEYTWYAVSYNDSTETPDVNHATGALQVEKELDLLRASGTVMVAATEQDKNKPLGIVFSHAFGRIGVELDTRGLFGTVSKADISVSGVTGVESATLNVLTGEWSNVKTYVPKFTVANLSNVQTADRKVGYIYTLDEPANAQNMKLTLNDLEIRLQNNTIRSFKTSLVGQAAEFNFPVRPRIGESQGARIRLIELSVDLGGLRWARTNLSNPAPGVYTFLPDNSHTNSPSTYFSFGGQRAMNYGYQGDPCRSVFPENTWRTPTRSDYERLPSNASYDVEGGRGYFYYPGATPTQDLRFNMNGYGLSVALVGNDPLITLNLNLQQYGTNAQYWTSTDEGILILRLTKIFFGGTQGGGADIGSELAIRLIGLDVLQTTFKNVRCVRAN